MLQPEDALVLQTRREEDCPLGAGRAMGGRGLHRHPVGT
jgi:hypothetical protein